MQNFTHYVLEQVERHPERLALCLPDYTRLHDWHARERMTFGALWERVSGFAHQLQRRGVAPGHRVLVLVPLSADLYALVLALMALGAAAVLVDAGQPRRTLVACIKAARAHALIGTPAVLRYRFAAPFLWRIPLRLVLDGRGLGLRRLHGSAEAGRFLPEDVSEAQGALITFTSGSTGAPKGALRTHRVLSSQHLALKEAFPPPEDEVALTCFPVVALHNLCCSVLTVLPAVDLRDVAAVRPDWILRQIEAEGVNALTGAPAFMRALTHFCHGRGVTLPQVRRVGLGGAPVDGALCRAVRRVFPRAEAVIIYGSTEAEPVASIGVDEVLQLHEDGAAERLGYPAGYVHACAEVRLIRIHKGPLVLQPGEVLSDREVADGAWGEVIVRGRHVNERYFENPQADRAHKIRDERGRVWHRMGDVACRDARGRLWLGGRREHLVERGGAYFYPLQVEAALQAVPGVRRTALHQHEGRILLWIEPEADRDDVLQGVRAAAERMGVPVDRLLTCASIPMDARHRSKVDYQKLEALARQVLD